MLKKVSKRKYMKHGGHLEHKYLPEFVYGGIDGAVTTFAVVSGVVGASLSSSIVLILGFANLFADGFSMATSNYVSTKTRNDLQLVKQKPIKTALATFVAFIVIGFIPLLSFVVGAVTGNEKIVSNQFLYSIALTGIAFLVVGWFKGSVSGKGRVYSAIETLVIGSIAATIAFAIGYLLRGLA